MTHYQTGEIVLWIGILAASVLVGILAQTVKRRTGAAWGLLTFCVCWLVYFVCAVVAAGSPKLQTADPETLTFALTLIATLTGGGAMSLIVATLPHRS